MSRPLAVAFVLIAAACTSSAGELVTLPTPEPGAGSEKVSPPTTDERPSGSAPVDAESPGRTDHDGRGAAAPSSTPTVEPLEPVPRPLDLPDPVGDGSVRALVTPSGVTAPVHGANPDGWVIGTPCGGAVTIEAGTTISGVHVLLDPGHGGADEPGAVGEAGVAEADVNLAVARLLQAELESTGVTTLLTRTGDYRMPIASRATMATTVEPLVFLSIHHNSAPGTAPSLVPGTEVYHQVGSTESRRLGGLLYEELVAAMASVGSDWITSGDAGVRSRLNVEGTDYYGVLRRSGGVVTALTEALYLSNPAEEALLRDPGVLQLEAEALARAVVRFLTTEDPGSGFAEGDLFLPGSTPPGGGRDGCVDPPLE